MITERTDTIRKSSFAEFLREQDFDSITYTRDQLAALIASVESDALLDAARCVWDELRETVAVYWLDLNMWDKQADAGTKGALKRADRRTTRLRARLDAYDDAFYALGCRMDIESDWTDGTVARVGLYREDADGRSFVVGSIARNA